MLPQNTISVFTSSKMFQGEKVVLHTISPIKKKGCKYKFWVAHNWHTTVFFPNLYTTLVQLSEVCGRNTDVYSFGMLIIHT